MVASPYALSGPGWNASGWADGWLVVVPASLLPQWRGSLDGHGNPTDDYERACAVDGFAGVIPLGDSGGQALVLADGPALTCYLPEHRAFVRWEGADSEDDLIRRALEVLTDPTVGWDDCGTWETDGPAVLMECVYSGAELGVGSSDGHPEHAPVPITSGRWSVQAVYDDADSAAYVEVIRLQPNPTA